MTVMNFVEGLSKQEIDQLAREKAGKGLMAGQGLPAQGSMTEQEKLEKLRRFDQEMRKRFGVKWAEPVPVPPEDADPGKAGAKADGAETEKAEREIQRTNPNRRENELMLNLMVLRNTLLANGPAVKERARRAGRTVWRDLRLMTVLVSKVQEALLKTMPKRRDDYYSSYAKHGHYELVMNGPIRNPRMVLISDKYLAAICEAAMEGECLQCFLDGSEIGTCPLRQALLEVAPPREIQDGKWKKCEYREAAGQLILGEDVTI